MEQILEKNNVHPWSPHLKAEEELFQEERPVLLDSCICAFLVALAVNPSGEVFFCLAKPELLLLFL